MINKTKNSEGKNFKVVLVVNLLLVMLLVAALFIFMILLKSINPVLPRIWSISIYAFIVILTLLAGITGIMVSLLLMKRKK